MEDFNGPKNDDWNILRDIDFNDNFNSKIMDFS